MPIGALFRPPLLVYLIWHPGNSQLASVAERVRDHFGTHRFRNVLGGAGINVAFQGVLDSGSPIPLQVNQPDFDIKTNFGAVTGRFWP
ncbi:MAG: hypothetical protein F4Z62_13385, partial [Rhodothermaceae bacterium]|nr:hypothetical protein [Rhodothermaceae bacterium]MYE62487.1 hypothetical protein [Rhodothermaceae bacterium]